MRVVLDTNTVASGFLRGNEPRAIIDAAIDGRIELFTCAALIEERQFHDDTMRDLRASCNLNLPKE